MLAAAAALTRLPLLRFQFDYVPVVADHFVDHGVVIVETIHSASQAPCQPKASQVCVTTGTGSWPVIDGHEENSARCTILGHPL
ncbi:hypothetical protein [Amycolatopsis sp. H20-H5]|uniref:hypothetical protein n=1 Tax=Amycolatopsis sp. H20-H5 TaxID=3046309 RepID=UPI002DB6B68E|nr:hypothetical protein [Amycolatopsis sp. H20-H5]MEC3974394.1 hypothetical protein [Amycolatopsis sp. H20-H5]